MSEYKQCVYVVEWCVAMCRDFGVCLNPSVSVSVSVGVWVNVIWGNPFLHRPGFPFFSAGLSSSPAVPGSHSCCSEISAPLQVSHSSLSSVSLSAEVWLPGVIPEITLIAFHYMPPSSTPALRIKACLGFPQNYIFQQQDHNTSWVFSFDMLKKS